MEDENITWTTVDQITDIIASKTDDRMLIDWQIGGFQQ